MYYNTWNSCCIGYIGGKGGGGGFGTTKNPKLMICMTDAYFVNNDKPGTFELIKSRGPLKIEPSKWIKFIVFVPFIRD